MNHVGIMCDPPLTIPRHHLGPQSSVHRPVQYLTNCAFHHPKNGLSQLRVRWAKLVLVWANLYRMGKMLWREFSVVG